MPDIFARSGLQIKVCVRTYRLFFVSDSEDVMLRLSTSQERASTRKTAEARDRKRRQWLEDYASKVMPDEPPKSATTEVAPKPPAVAQPESALPSDPIPGPSPGVEAKDTEMRDVIVTKDEEKAPTLEPSTTTHTGSKDGATAANAAPASEANPADVPMEDGATPNPPAEGAKVQVSADIAERVARSPEGTPMQTDPTPPPVAQEATSSAIQGVAPPPAESATPTAAADEGRPTTPASAPPPHPTALTTEPKPESKPAPSSPPAPPPETETKTDGPSPPAPSMPSSIPEPKTISESPTTSVPAPIPIPQRVPTMPEVPPPAAEEPAPSDASVPPPPPS